MPLQESTVRLSVRRTAALALALCAAWAPKAADGPAITDSSTGLDRRLPPDYQLSPAQAREFSLGNATLKLYARAFAQGEAVYLELLADSASGPGVQPPDVRYDGRAVHLSRRVWGYRGFFPIPADGRAGEKALAVEYALPDTSRAYRFALTVDSTAFAVSHATMDVGRYSDVDHARDPAVQRFIAECSARKAKAFARRGSDMVAGPFASPRDQLQVTSPFWSSRVYERYRMEDGARMPLPPSRKTHRGLDLRGARGDPVFAMADGEVALADSLYYEGNFVVIDHGNRLMSYYMHQDSLLVSAGQRVQAGQEIGTVGATGVATAAHPHVSVLIDGVQVDPLSLLPLPIRD
jgi:murein DD-endopeptidase